MSCRVILDFSVIEQLFNTCPSAGQSPLDRRQGSAGHAVGPDQHPVCAFQPQRAAGPPAHHPLPVLRGAGEDEDFGGAIQTLLQL